MFPKHWQIKPANEICNAIVDCVNKTAPIVDYDTEFKMIRTTNVKNGRIILDGMRCVEEDVFLKWNRRLTPKKGDVVLTREAPLGDVGLIRTNHKFFLGQRTMIYRADGINLNQRFLYYSLLGGPIQGQLKALGSGSTVEHIRVPDAEKISIPFPPISEQKKIAAVLSAYDDLIENNKKRIQILENMAEELYKEWFVRFRFPNWENTEFEKGIPKNWVIVGFSELVSINPKESLDKNETYRFVGMEYLSTDSSFFYSDEYRLGNAGSKFRNGDILFPRITPCVENGKKGLVSTLKENEVACGSTEFIVFREKVLPKEYIYLLCKQSSFRQHAEQSMIGASGRQRVTLNCFNKFYLPLPNNELLKEFTRHTQSYFSLIVELHVKNRKLAEIRDSLLPRLISGKLSVEELDIQFPSSMQEQ